MLQRATNHVAHVGYIVALLISTYSIPALPLDLNNAQLVTRTTPVTWDEHIEYYLSTGFPGVTYAYFTFDAASEIYITLNDKNELSKIRAARESDKNFKFTYDVLKKWPLTRWPHLTPTQEITHDLDEFGFHERRMDVRYSPGHPQAGCFNQHPLRYGDIDGDAKNEIVLFLNGEFIVFSPQYERTVFAAFIDDSDWLRSPEDIEAINPKEPFQHYSQYLYFNNVDYQAHRSYTKIYIGDFDENGHTDILSWQKVYASNKKDEADGFHLVRSELKHYERDLEAQEQSAQGITGEYQPQSTTQDTIQQWLADRQLTWKAGFPSNSECKGEEGKLIPEMHDPLLNDPEVLQ